METQFQKQLKKLQKNILEMGSLVEEQTLNVLKAVETMDEKVISQIISNEEIVNKLDVKIEKLCVKLVVLNQPVAMDMRIIFSAITIINNLERIGDLALKIAKWINEVNYSKSELELIQFNEISYIVRKMLKHSTTSVTYTDIELANKTILLENKLNEITKLNFDKLRKYMKENSDRIDEALFLYELLHSLERIGDLTTNIAEGVYFVSEAENIRHKYETTFFENEIEEEN